MQFRLIWGNIEKAAHHKYLRKYKNKGKWRYVYPGEGSRHKGGEGTRKVSHRQLVGKDEHYHEGAAFSGGDGKAHFEIVKRDGDKITYRIDEGTRSGQPGPPFTTSLGEFKKMVGDIHIEASGRHADEGLKKRLDILNRAREHGTRVHVLAAKREIRAWGDANQKHLSPGSRGKVSEALKYNKAEDGIAGADDPTPPKGDQPTPYIDTDGKQKEYEVGSPENQKTEGTLKLYGDPEDEKKPEKETSKSVVSHVTVEHAEGVIDTIGKALFNHEMADGIESFRKPLEKAHGLAIRARDLLEELGDKNGSVADGQRLKAKKMLESAKQALWGRDTWPDSPHKLGTSQKYKARDKNTEAQKNLSLREQAKQYNRRVVDINSHPYSNTRGWTGRIIEKGGSITTDGHSLIRLDALKSTPAKQKHLSKEGDYSLPVDQIEQFFSEMVEKAKNSKTKPLFVAGVQQGLTNPAAEKIEVGHQAMLFRGEDDKKGHPTLLNADKLRFFQEHVDYDSIKQVNNKAPVVFFKNNEAVGAIMPLRPDKDNPRYKPSEIQAEAARGDAEHAAEQEIKAAATKARAAVKKQPSKGNK